MKKLRFGLVLAFVFVLALAQCSGSTIPDRVINTPENNPVIYLAGYSSVYESSIEACYWASDTTAPALIGDNLAKSVATSICVSKGNIYTAGDFHDSFWDPNYRACYWTNNSTVPTVLGAAGIVSTANAICVYDDNIYIAGYSQDRACYWVNSNITPIFLGETGSEAKSISVKRGKIYTAGRTKDTSGNYKACYWSTDLASGSTTLTILNEGEIATSLCVAGCKIYIAGSSNNEACFWTTNIKTNNTTLTTLGATGMATSICAYRRKIYIAGSSNNKACYWTANGSDSPALTILSEERSGANSLCVFEGIIYTAGYTGDYWYQKACYWMSNGTGSSAVTTYGKNGYICGANSICVR